ncbi:MAG: HIT family protein [Bacteroidetes bacterium]|nr:HIT family protein [Bacteroidota bacterium]MDA0904162.1 HIT family protein [Bacteroidota bacterium]MDA1242686.1 HIT family protein [Bacteroidota bacterium]
MASIFSRIVAGEIPCHKVAESDQFLAFLDIMPLAVGHTLVIPKLEVDRVWDLEPIQLGELHVFSQQVALAIEAVIPCQRVGQAVIGLEVPHAHVHLIPLNSVSDINFERPKLTVSHENLAKTASEIRAVLEGR